MNIKNIVLAIITVAALALFTLGLGSLFSTSVPDEGNQALGNFVIGYIIIAFVLSVNSLIDLIAYIASGKWESEK